eukprot:TRINITY_DN17608_c0_g1_i5.p1 TRINITY_DN17608_c0_g1~~TRINITY_DN17608_c0_g1_i5.p1  ORF type:complete len:230 (-),score=43.39 TRINITY_DN17608_c0_g1_i5:276-965(-)
MAAPAAEPAAAAAVPAAAPVAAAAPTTAAAVASEAAAAAGVTAAPAAVAAAPAVMQQPMAQAYGGQMVGGYGSPGGYPGQMMGGYGGQPMMGGYPGQMQPGMQPGQPGMPGQPGVELAPQFNFRTIIRCLMEVAAIVQGFSLVGAMGSSWLKEMGSNEEQPLRRFAVWIYGSVKGLVTSVVPFVGSRTQRVSLENAWATETAQPRAPTPWWVVLGFGYFMFTLYLAGGD